MGSNIMEQNEDHRDVEAAICGQLCTIQNQHCFILDLTSSGDVD